MSTKSITSLRRISGYALTLLLCCGLFTKGAEAQGTTPSVTASFPTSLTVPSGVGGVLQTAVDNYGNWLVPDWVNGALYEYPAGGGAVITLAPPGTMGGLKGYQNPGITFDTENNLYFGGNYNNCLLLFPYDPASNTWPGLATLNTVANTGPDQCGVAPFSFARYNLITAVPPEKNNYFQPWGIAMLPNNVLVIGDQSGKFIFTLPVIFAPTVGDCASDGNCSPTATPGSDNANAATLVLLTMKERPNTVAADKFGNIYFTEDSGGLSGAYMIPAGETAVPADTDPSIVRVDPNLANVTGVATDPSGNVYVGDSQAGVFLIPNPSGTPNTAGAILLTPTPAGSGVSVDPARGILYVPSSTTSFAEVTFNSAELGSAAAGVAPTTSSPVDFDFNGTVTPASIVIQEAGVTNADFTIASGGTCATGTQYAALSSCTVNIAFGPHSVGSVSGKLVMLDGSGNTLASITLHGTGTGSAAQVLPGGESPIDSGLKTPSQVAIDANGNTYVADPGLGAVEEFPKGGGTVTTIGTGLTSPTGVAVDGAGDVFIADSGSGTVVEVPNGPNGLNAAGQITLKSGLGTNLKLAADGSGNLYISDPINQRVVKLSGFSVAVNLLSQTETDLTGFNTPTAVAVDSSNNLYVTDGTNLFEVTTAGATSTLLSSLSGATGLAVDPSGAVYVVAAGGVLRIPDESGTLNQGDATTVAPDVTNPSSVAVDSAGNVYIADATADDVDVVSTSASVNFGTLTSTTATQTENVTIIDSGNAPLNITGFSSTPDFSETSTTCTGPVAVGTTCSATLTFNPGPGDQGNLSGQVLLQSDAANAPVGVNAVGVGAPLAASKITATVTNATVNGAPVSVTVAPASGSGTTPTGTVNVTISGNGITPIVTSQTLNNGAVSFVQTQIPAGSYQFTIAYVGDRTYSGATTVLNVVVAPGAVSLVQPTMAQVQQDNPYYPYVLSSSGNTYEPYDGSQNTWNYTYTVQVVAADGSPLIGAPVYDSTGKLVAENYGSVTFQGAPYNALAGTGCPPIPVSSNGTVALDTTCLTITATNTSIPDIFNTYTVTPQYSPNGTGTAEGSSVNPNYTTATGTSITFTAVANPMVQISSNPSSLSVASGSSATATLTVSSVLGYGHAGINGLEHNYSLPVQLVCDGLPAYASCNFSYPNPAASDPNSVQVGPAPGTMLTGGTVCTTAMGCTGPGTVMLTISTNVSSGVASLHRTPSKTVFAAMLGLGLLGFAFGRKRPVRERLMTLACLVVSCGIMAGASGCSTTQLGVTNGTPTPAGMYNVSITAREVGSGPVSPGPPFVTYGSNNQVSLPFTLQVTVSK